MKKRIVALLLSMVLVMASCGSANEQGDVVDHSQGEEQASLEDNTEASTGDAFSDLEALGKIDVEEQIFSVELTIPTEFVEQTTQEELDVVALENGFKSATLNEDGSATYIMTKQQHQELLDDLRKGFNESFAEMVGSEDCPNITKIEANDNFSEFTVTIAADELSMNESMIVFSFYMAAGIYNVYSGEEIDNVHVEYVNAETGEVISTADSNANR